MWVSTDSTWSSVRWLRQSGSATATRGPNSTSWGEQQAQGGWRAGQGRGHNRAGQQQVTSTHQIKPAEAAQSLPQARSAGRVAAKQGATAGSTAPLAPCLGVGGTGGGTAHNLPHLVVGLLAKAAMQVGAVRHGVHLEQQEEAPRRSIDALQADRPPCCLGSGLAHCEAVRCMEHLQMARRMQSPAWITACCVVCTST
jgi:hypothetical protein